MIKFVGGMLLCCTLFGFAGLSPAQARSAIDPSFIPLAPSEIRSALVKSEGSTLAMFATVRRIENQNEVDAAYKILDELAAVQTDNPAVLEGFCIIRNDHMSPFFHKGNGTVEETDGSDDHYEERLQRAYKLDKRPWLPLVLDGQALFWFWEHTADGMAKLIQASQIAPDVAFVHYVLGNAYDTPGTPYHSPRLAIAQYERAFQLDPRYVDVPIILVHVYLYVVPDRAKAIEWKNVALSLVPSIDDLRPATQKLLRAAN